MKLVLLVFCIALFSVLVYARDLDSLAKKERARRQALAQKGGPRGSTFTSEDLERYRSEPAEPAPRPVVRPRRERDLAKERAFWEKERERHERELARLDASIRRLEWRLKEKESRRPPGGRLVPDPALGLLEDSIGSLRAERQRLDEEFRERARKAGALPGWVR